MRTVLRTSVVGIAVLLFALLELVPAAAGESPAVSLQLADAGAVCAGDVATVSWAPATDLADVTEYEVEQRIFHPGGPSFVFTRVPADQTHLQATLGLGANIFVVWAISSTGFRTPIGGGGVTAHKPPSSMYWQIGGSTVGDGKATVRFAWGGPPTLSVTGGTVPATVRITASPGGATLVVTSSPTSPYEVSATFTGLTNGVAYTFTAVTFNHCGSSGPQTSPTFTPGVAPQWTRGTPPLTVGTGQYVYKFAAVGDPAPTYRLVNAPAWLEISPNGLVNGRPPAGTQSFTYSVVATNGVGIAPLWLADARAGPFTVTVRSP